MQDEYRRGASDFCRILGHHAVYERSIRYISSRHRAVLLDQVEEEGDGDEGNEAGRAWPADPITHRGWGSDEPMRRLAVAVHVTETVDRGIDGDGDGDGRDAGSGGEEDETSSDDDDDEWDVTEAEQVEWTSTAGLTYVEHGRAEWVQDTKDEEEEDRAAFSPPFLGPEDGVRRRRSWLDDRCDSEVKAPDFPAVGVTRQNRPDTGKTTGVIAAQYRPLAG
jgi:hypothetical protein